MWSRGSIETGLSTSTHASLPGNVLRGKSGKGIIKFQVVKIGWFAIFPDRRHAACQLSARAETFASVWGQSLTPNAPLRARHGSDYKQRVHTGLFVAEVAPATSASKIMALGCSAPTNSWAPSSSPRLGLFGRTSLASRRSFGGLRPQQQQQVSQRSLCLHSEHAFSRKICGHIAARGCALSHSPRISSIENPLP